MSEYDSYHVVEVSNIRLEELQLAEMMLDALRVYGVDNWIGYQASVDLFNKWVAEAVWEEL